MHIEIIYSQSFSYIIKFISIYYTQKYNTSRYVGTFNYNACSLSIKMITLRVKHYIWRLFQRHIQLQYDERS